MTSGYAASRTHTSKGVILLLSCAAQFMVVLDVAIVNVALPSIQHMLSRLASVPLAERVEIPGLHPDRAPTIVAGVVILIETMRAFELKEIAVSEHDILYGTALAAADHR